MKNMERMTDEELQEYYLDVRDELLKIRDYQDQRRIKDFNYLLSEMVNNL